MDRDTKFGYGYALIGVGVPYAVDKLLGPTAALITISVILIVGCVFLIAGHIHGRTTQRKIFMTIWIFSLYGAGLGALSGGLWGGISHVIQAAHQKHDLHPAASTETTISPKPADKTVSPSAIPPAKSVVSSPNSLVHIPKSVSPIVMPHADIETPIIVSATLHDPLNMTITASNESDELAEGVFWQLFVYREKDQTFFSYRGDLGFIKAHDKSGVYELNMTGSARLTDSTGTIDDGDIFTGTLIVDCPKCKGQTYIVQFSWKESGWFSFYDEGHGKIFYSRDPSKNGVAQAVAQFLMWAPVESRIPILPRQR